MADRSKLAEAVRDPRVLASSGFVLLTASLAGVLGWLLHQWVYFAVAALILLALLITYLIYSLHRRESAERAARGTGAADDATVMQRRQELRPRGSAASVEQRFHKAQAVIEARSLRALPWYLVIGPSGGGKSALLRASGLKLPPAVESLVDPGPTGSVSFWLSDEAVLVDVAGRLTATHEGEDHKEWRELLTLIAKERGRPALQGVLVALSAADLVTSPSAQLEADASELRRHLNEVVDTLGIDPPVYLVVTQADRVQGFAEAAAGFPATRLQEMYGWTNRDRHPSDVALAVRDAFARLRARIELALPELLVREPEVERRGRAALLPHELSALGRALAGFAARAFQPTRYDEVPFLRGIYLTSARREGELVSPVLERLGQRFSPGMVDPNGPPGGWFTRDLFRRLILDPEEQALCVVTERVGPRTRTLLVAVAAAFAVACLGLWGTAFVNGWRSIGELRDRTQAALAQRSSLKGLDELRVRIQQAESDLDGWGHGYGLGSALRRAMRSGQQTFAQLFWEHFEQGVKTAMLDTVSPTNPAAFAALLDVMADVNFLDDLGRDESLRPRVEDYAQGLVSSNMRDSLAPNYVAWVRWSSDAMRETERKRAQNRFDARAAQLLHIANLEAWCASSVSAAKLPKPVRPEDLLGSTVPGAATPPSPAQPSEVEPAPVAATPAVAVSGCYTRDFYEHWLKRVFASMDPNDREAKQNLRVFRDDYAARYRDAWQAFVLSAPRTPRAEANVAGSPYLGLIESVLDNTDVDGLWQGAVATPSWVTALRDVRREDGGTDEMPAPWVRYRKTLEDVAAEVQRTSAPQIAFDEARKAASGGDSVYKKSLESVIQLFPAPPESPERTTLQALQALLAMPVLNGFTAMLSGAASQVDYEWQNRIVSRFAGLGAAPESYQQLCGPNGAINGFRSEVLGPFWTGSMPRPLLADRGLPLSPRFVAFFGSVCGAGGGAGGGGAPPPTGPQTVTLVGAPSDVRGADGLFVIDSKLTLLCATSNEPQEFEYSDGQGRRAFRWDPDGGCEMVTLAARVRDANGNEQDLERSWNGPFAFAQFLRAGAARGDGTQAWSIAHPSEPGVEAVVRYRRTGGDGILRFEEAASRTLPPTVR